MKIGMQKPTKQCQPTTVKALIVLILMASMQAPEYSTWKWSLIGSTASRTCLTQQTSSLKGFRWMESLEVWFSLLSVFYGFYYRRAGLISMLVYNFLNIFRYRVSMLVSKACWSVGRWEAWTGCRRECWMHKRGSNQQRLAMLHRKTSCCVLRWHIFEWLPHRECK